MAQSERVFFLELDSSTPAHAQNPGNLRQWSVMFLIVFVCLEVMVQYDLRVPSTTEGLECYSCGILERRIKMVDVSL